METGAVPERLTATPDASDECSISCTVCAAMIRAPGDRYTPFARALSKLVTAESNRVGTRRRNDDYSMLRRFSNEETASPVQSVNEPLYPTLIAALYVMLLILTPSPLMSSSIANAFTQSPCEHNNSAALSDPRRARISRRLARAAGSCSALLRRLRPIAAERSKAAQELHGHEQG